MVPRDMTKENGGAVRPSVLEQFYPLAVNVADEAFRANIRSACGRALPWLKMQPEHDGHAVIVGGGPSLADNLDELRWRYEQGQRVIALNNTGAWLLERGVVPFAHVMLDARESNVRFVQYDPPNTKFLIASQCCPAMFDALRGRDVTLWHPNIEGIQEFIGDTETALIGGGTTVGLQAMSIAYVLGYRKIHLYGFDSSYRGMEGHAYDQKENDGEAVTECWVGSHKFLAAPWMIYQANQFVGAGRQLADLGCVITVAGDGLLPHMAQEMMRPIPEFTVLTVYRSGGQYGPEYVTRLRDGVATGLSRPHAFVCMTDDPIPGVDCIPFELGLPGWWSKPEIFRPDLPAKRVLYLDLSCVVTGSLDDMAMQDGIVITADWYHGGPSQSVLLYNVGDFTNLWETFAADPAPWMTEGDKCIAPNFGDQILVRELPVPEMKYWQDVLPGHLVSYKVHGVTPDCRLVKFHGQPKPADVNWLQQPERHRAHG